MGCFWYFTLILLSLGAPKLVRADVAPLYQVQIKNYIIHPVTHEYISHAIKSVQTRGGQGLIIQLDTPGGLLSSTQELVKEMLNAEVPLIVYIAPAGSRAASAGVFITLAAHVAAMAPGTHIGAAHPVQLGERGQKISFKKVRKKLEGKSGENQKEEPSAEKDAGGEVMGEKILNDTLAWVENIASARGRNVSWAKRAVKESITSTEGEAKAQNVVDLISKDTQELLASLDGKVISLPQKKVTLKTKGAALIPIDMNWRQKFLNVILNPNIAYILMILGFYGLLFEFTHSGAYFPGIAGTICLILALYAFHVLPTNFAGLGLIALGLAMLIAEVKVVSYGFLTLGGIVSMLLGSLFLFDSPADFLQISLRVVVPFVAASAALVIFLVTLAVRAQRTRAVTGQEGLIGEIGEVDISLNPSGKVLVHGEIWDAVSEGFLEKGTSVEVTAVKGMRLRVRSTKPKG